MKRCSRCRLYKPIDDFYRQRAAWDGRSPSCKDCDSAKRALYPRPTEVYTPRDRERHRARRRAYAMVWKLIRDGRLEPASKRKCTDCGASAAHYDHHRGYEGVPAIVVQPLCLRCHGLRARALGEYAANGSKRRDAANSS